LRHLRTVDGRHRKRRAMRQADSPASDDSMMRVLQKSVNGQQSDFDLLDYGKLIDQAA
jgi:hypothetical protein